MNPDLTQAIQLLNKGGYTCVLCKEQQVYTSTQRGVKPLIDLLGEDLTGFSAADKVVGKATALLYCLFNIRALHANVISESALAVLHDHKIPTSYTELVPHIINRTGDGKCPMELATEHISDPKAAPDIIRTALKKISDKNNT